jgi:hypothetical protein
MSVKAMQWVAQCTVGRSSDKAVLVALANYHHEKTGDCRPGIDTLAAFTELNRKTVMPALDRLRDEGFIDFDKGTRRHRSYVLNFDRNSPNSGTKGGRDNSPNFGTLKGAPIVPKTDAHSPKIGTLGENPIVPNPAAHSPKSCLLKSQRLDHEQENRKEQEKNPPIVPPSKANEPLTGELLAASEAPDPFDEFWQAYPRKTGKADARKAFAKCREPVANLVADIRQRLAEGHWSTASDRKRFIMHPATYLRGERWNDEIIPGDLPMDAQSVADRTNAQLDRLRDMDHDSDDPFALAGNIHRLRTRQ